jgi:hypothetical protein
MDGACMEERGSIGRETSADSTAATPSPGWLGIARRFPLVLGVGAGIALCLLGALTLALLRGGASVVSLPAPAPVAQQICADLQHQDYTDLYTLLSAAQRSTGDAAQFAASQRQLDVASGAVTSCSVAVVESTGGKADVRFSVTRAQTGASTGQGSLVYESNSWRLDAYDASTV